MTVRTLRAPTNKALPFFVYGALKPGMPAFHRIQPLALEPFEPARVEGSLYVRDGLPLLILEPGMTEGYLLRWKHGSEEDGYRLVCEFEPPKHYQWAEVTLESGIKANALVARFRNKGNPQPLFSSVWRLADDPGFGEGLPVVREATEELESATWNDWQRFFRAQMAYLLLWSVLERLSALCFGPGEDPHKRVTSLAELPGMGELVKSHVQRADRVSDSRDPSQSYELNGSDAKKCFQYYYQVRSNLSHRGKGVYNEFAKVKESLSELLAIAEGYLQLLRAGQDSL